MFSSDNQRYNRNILVPDIGIKGQNKLFSSKVLVAGAGGLASTVIANLASLGIGNIGIVDDDKLELSNFNRQYIHTPSNIGKLKVESALEWIKKYNPDIAVETFALRMTEKNSGEIIKKFDIIVDCFDSFESKFMLNRVCVHNKKTLIHGGVTEFYGQVHTVIPGRSACLSCIVPESDGASTTVKGVLSPAVSTIASIQSMEVLKIIIGTGELLTNQLLTYDGKKQEFKKHGVVRNTRCQVCSSL
jgi:molybdopterin-synthase adenylyltransferase